jgi:hypothetical protein
MTDSCRGEKLSVRRMVATTTSLETCVNGINEERDLSLAVSYVPMLGKQ